MHVSSFQMTDVLPCSASAPGVYTSEGVYTPRFRELTRNCVRSYRYRITCSANTGSILAYRFPFLT
jgi:hypothetical protein